MKSERNNKILKLLDKTIGIPLVYLLGILRFKKNIPKNINTIAILATAAIGDTIIMSGVVNSIKKKYPNSKIILFCGASNYEVAKLLSNIDKIEKLPIKNIIKSIEIIRQYKFDIWIDFGPWPRLNALLSHFADALFKIGFKTEKQHRHYIYDDYILHSDYIHEHENYCNLIQLINIEKFEQPNLQLSSHTNFDNLQKYVVLHFFAGGSKADLKQLKDEQWKDIIEYLILKNYQIYLTGALSDYKKLEEFILQCQVSVKNMAGKLSLNETAHLLKTAKLVISIDTGIMHLASALNVNLISIHGPTSPKRWGPLSENSHSIYLDYKCSPCISLGFESHCKDNQCIRLIQVNDIISIIEKNKFL